MTTIAYTALHYGSPYLAYAIRSVIDHVSEYHVLYAPQPSHGHRVNGQQVPDSESRDNLYRIAMLAAGNKLEWHDGDWRIEGQQRDSIFTIAPHAEIVLVVDYDEIWPTLVVPDAIQQMHAQGRKVGRLPMIHFWRSFRRAMLHDPALPTRIFYRDGVGEVQLDTPPICHMGYAIPDWLMQYKRSIHGHKNEFRKDINWWSERWTVNAQQDCHPVGSEYWNTEVVEPLEYLPGWMVNHPFYNEEVIR